MGGPAPPFPSLPPVPRVLADVAPLRDSRDFRRLFTGQLISFLGSQLTVVAVAVQVFQITRSSFAVGLVSLAQLPPLVVGSLIGGSVADSTDRRRLLLVMQVALALTGVPLALNAMRGEGAALWPVVVFSALAAGLSGIERPARSAAIPSMFDDPEQLPAAYALWQILIQVGSVVGPALSGLLLARFGLAGVYWIDVVSFAAAFVAVLGLQPLPPRGGATKAGLGSIAEGLRFLRGRPVIQGVFLADINAMVFGMPRALFPALGTGLYGGGEATVGLLFAAPGAGALLGALLTGWVARVRRQGRAVFVAVGAWGLAIAAFGLASWLPLGLLLLAVAGAADVVSAVFRNTVLQSRIPDNLRGRLSAVQISVVTGGPRLGDLESGTVAALAGPRFSVVSGGLACLAGVAVLARTHRAFWDFDAGHPEA